MAPSIDTTDTSEDQSSSNLLALPFELRSRIYYYIFSSDPPRLLLDSPSSKSLGKNIVAGDVEVKLSYIWLDSNSIGPGLLLSCKQVHHEIHDHFLQSFRTYMNYSLFSRYEISSIIQPWSHQFHSRSRELATAGEVLAKSLTSIVPPVPSKFLLFSHLRNLVFLFKSKANGGAIMQLRTNAELTRRLRQYFPSLERCVWRRVYEVNLDCVYDRDTDIHNPITRKVYDQCSDTKKISLWNHTFSLDWAFVVTGAPLGQRGFFMVPHGRQRGLEEISTDQLEQVQSEQDLYRRGNGNHSLTKDVEIILEGEMRILCGQSWAQLHIETIVYRFRNPFHDGRDDLSLTSLQSQHGPPSLLGTVRFEEDMKNEILSTIRLVSEQERLKRLEEMPLASKMRQRYNRALFP